MNAAIRLAAGGTLALWVGAAVTRVEMPLLALVAAALVAALTLWRPAAGLTAIVAITPAGLLIAPAPVSVAELVAWTFVSAWLLCVWRPLVSETTARPTLRPALLFAGCALASWLGYTLAHARGIEPLALPLFLLRSLPSDHVLFSSPVPETWTFLQLAAGMALFCAAALLCAQRTVERRWLAAAMVGSTTLLAVLTIGDVLREWALAGYTEEFLRRYVRGERFALHLADLNAAGSQYVLGGLIALAMAVADRPRRWLWTGAIVLMLPALWLSGSRSAALGALLVGASVIPWVRDPAAMSRRREAIGGLAVLAIVVSTSALLMARQPEQQGTATNALRFRSQFLITSARMFASAPVFGVGIGHYHERSNEFMPPALREVYSHENAHNYFAQQFAELGLVGGGLFLWFVLAVGWRGWRDVRASSGTEAATLGLFAGSVGYLLTCTTGHPLLVPEAAIPFWALFGALAGGLAGGVESARTRNATVRRLSTVAVVAVWLVGVGRQGLVYARDTSPPLEQGFYATETTSDGTAFNWMTGHGSFYVGPHPGYLSVLMQAPALPRQAEPFIVRVDIGGTRVGAYEIPPGTWTTIQLPISGIASMPFRRVDLRANQSWTRRNAFGDHTDIAPRSVMVGVPRWTPAGAR